MRAVVNRQLRKGQDWGQPSKLEFLTEFDCNDEKTDYSDVIPSPLPSPSRGEGRPYV
jgi:hypothetical protein